MTIYVIRHADKEPGEYSTRGLPLNDPPISDCGRQRAAKLAGFFSEVEIDSITASGYIRAAQTIRAVAEDKGLEITIDPRLNETNIGDLERLTDDEVMNTYPEFWEAYLARDRDFRFPNGESGEEAGTRVFEMFCSLGKGGNHILVAHDGIIRILICKILGLPVYRRHLFRIDYCSITTFEYDEVFKCWTAPRINYRVGDDSF